MSCAGNGYLTGNMLVAFPFEDGSCLSWPSGTDRRSAQDALQKCFVDSCVNVSSQTIPSGGWPSIGNFVKSQGALSFVISACGSSVRMSVSPSSTKFPIVSGSAPFGSYTVVLSSEGIEEFLSSSFSPPASGTSSPSVLDGDLFLRLCERCITKRPLSISSIRVYDGVNKKSEGPHFVLSGDVSVVPGNNMSISEPDDEIGMTLNAVPGAGLGVVPCGCESTGTKKFQLAGSDGHSRIFNDTCYDIEPYIETIEKNGSEKRVGNLKIHAKCTACCTCSMYESIVNERLKPLSDAIRSARSNLKSILSTYESSVARFNQRLSRPTLNDVSVSLSGMPVGSNLASKLSDTNVKGKMGRCAFTAIVRNSSFSEIRASVYSIAGTDSVVEVSASWSNEEGSPLSMSGDSANSIVGKTFSLYPGRSLVITYVSLKNEMVGSVSTGGYSGSVSIGLSYRSQSGQSGSLGIVNKSVEV